MSQQELERTDQEVMDLVNSEATPEALASAEEIEQRVREIESEQQRKAEAERDAQIRAAEEEKARQEAYYEAMRRSEERYHRRQFRKQIFQTVLTVALCGLISAMLVVVLFVPEVINWVAYAGIVVCCTVAGIRVDRQVRQGRW